MRSLSKRLGDINGNAAGNFMPKFVFQQVAIPQIGLISALSCDVFSMFLFLVQNVY